MHQQGRPRGREVIRASRFRTHMPSPRTCHACARVPCRTPARSRGPPGASPAHAPSPNARQEGAGHAPAPPPGASSP
eukprot:3385928-Pyramimonas_sp.AAC.1